MADSQQQSSGNAAGQVVMVLGKQAVGAVLRWSIVTIGASAGFFLILLAIAILLIVIIFAGAKFGASTPVEAAPIPGDGIGLDEEFCTKAGATNCSYELWTIFTKAGAWAKVPAGVIAGIASKEAEGIFGYTNEEVKQFSAINGTPPNVGIDGQGITKDYQNPNSCGAIGPMQMLIDRDSNYPTWIDTCPNPNAATTNTWTQSGTSPTKYKQAVNLGMNFNIPNPDARNIRNAIYGAAWKMKCDSKNGLPTTECVSGNFSKYDYNDDTDDWEKEEVFAAGGAYHGSCSYDKNGNDIIDASPDPDIDEVDAYCEEAYQFYLDTKDSAAVPGKPFGWPVSGTMTQGPYEASPSHGNWSAMDIGNKDPQPVYATHDGNVFRYPDSGDGFGNYVEVFSSTYTTRYAHLESFSSCLKALPNNTIIKAGTYLGTTGWTGYVIPAGPDGRHLHYHIFDNAGRDILLEEFNSLTPEPYTYGNWVDADYSGSECILGP